MGNILSKLMATAAAIVIGATTAHAADPIKIGLVLEYSGPFADTAKKIDEALTLYAEQHNNQVCGRPIEILRKDTGGIAPDVAARLAQELIVRDKSDVLAGFATSPNAFGVAPISAKAKKFMVVMNAQTTGLLDETPYSVRTSATTPQMNYPFGDWVAKHGTKNVYTLVADFGPGHDAEKSFTESFKAAGGTIVGADRAPVSNADYSSFVLRMKDAAPEAVYLWVPGGNAPMAISKALANRGLNPPGTKVYSQGEFTTEDVLASLGDAAVGVTTAYYYTWERPSPENETFVKAYHTKFGHNPDAFSVGGYDGMRVIFEALEKTGCDTSGTALVEAAKGLSWESPRGPFKIDANTRDVVQTIWIREVQKVDGKLKNVVIDQIDNVSDPYRGKK